MIRTVASICSLSAALALAQPPAHIPPYPHLGATLGYKADPGWPQEKVPGGDWGAMSSVAIGPDGNIWTFNRGKIPVQVFSPEGKLVKFWGQDGGLFRDGQRPPAGTRSGQVAQDAIERGQRIHGAGRSRWRRG